MASKRSSSGKRKSRRSAGKSGSLWPKLISYPLVIIAGLYAGIQFSQWRERGDETREKPRVSAATSSSSEGNRRAQEREQEHVSPRQTARARSSASEDLEKLERKEPTPRPKVEEVEEPKVQVTTAGSSGNTPSTPAAEAEPSSQEGGDVEGREPQTAASGLPEVGNGPKAETEVPKPVTPAPKPTTPAPKVETPRRQAGTGAAVQAVEIDRGVGRRAEVSLTFDAGADWKPVKKILDALAAENIKTTFFLTGEWVKKYPKSARLIAEQGHEIGNHSWNHPPFTKLSDTEIQDQLRRTEEVIQQTVGKSSRPWFRPPLGDRDRRVRRTVADAGYYTVYWTLDSRDSVDKGITSKQIRDRVLGKVGPGSIVLLHCGSEATANAVPDILRGLRDRGLTSVTVSKLLEE